jgi:hypothetical protein
MPADVTDAAGATGVNGTTELAAPSGPGALDPTGGISQADTEAIARRLFGDAIVDKLGDVMGARKPTLADGIRDFVIASTKGLDTLEALRQKQREDFQNAFFKAQQAAAAKALADRQTVKTVLDAIKTVQGLPPGQRAAVLKETLDQAGIPYSQAAIKMFTDADILSQLPMDQLDQAADQGKITTADVAGVFGSGLNAAKFHQSLALAKQDQEKTQNLILDRTKTALQIQDTKRRLQQDPNAAARQRFIANRLGRLKVTDPATGESRPATYDEIDQMADQVFGPRVGAAPRGLPTAPQAGIPQPSVQRPQAAAPQSPLTVPTTTTTTTTNDLTTTPTTGGTPGAPTPAPRIVGITRVK